MRIFATDMNIVSLALRRKNYFWVEEQSFEDDSLHHYDVCGMSWRRFKKRKLKEDHELYTWW